MIGWFFANCRFFFYLLSLRYMMQEKIREKIHEQLPLLKAKYHVKKIGIFGSFVRDEQKKGSDLDILVEFETPIGFFDFIRLENLLSRTLRKKVDLVSKKAIKPAVKKGVLKEVQYV
ncbi:MAG: polymerase beta domain protein region protein [Parcubacteria group bacterium GW2011_GWA2_47_26]|nr:MAG: polymerase beta domain protein region protein [Parcubacteria group bacterium GW2011_GWA2_47_26]